MVVCLHLTDVSKLPAQVGAAIPPWLMFALDHGWLGVDLFFILSGFLITGILLDSRDKPGYFRNFYARRFLRIIPLYFTVIAVMWASYRYGSRYFVLCLLFLANFNHAFNAHAPHGASVFWSLAVEEHFYLAWPWAVRLLTRKALTLTACAIVLAAPILRLWAFHAGWNPAGEIYTYSPFRFDGLAIGALLAIWTRSRWANRRTSLQLVAGLVAFSIVLTVAGLPLGIMSKGSPFRYTQVDAAFAGGVLAAVALRGAVYCAPLRWPFAKLSGELSYCIYLIHVGVLDSYQYFVRTSGIDTIAIFGPRGALIVRGLVVVGVVFALAGISRRFLEQPILRLKKHFEYGGGERQAEQRTPVVETAVKSKTRVYLTIDAETSMGSAWTELDRYPLPIEKRILCQRDGHAYGLSFMVDALRGYGFQATFFVEVFSALCLGEEPIRRVFDYLLESGQDVQLHTHPTFRNYALATRNGHRKDFAYYKDLPDDINRYGREEQRALLREAHSFFLRFAGFPPVAYRAGSFHANVDTLAALPESIVIDSSYDPSDGQSFSGTRLRPNVVQKVEGIFEFPVSVGSTGVGPFRRYKHLEISAVSLRELETALLEAHTCGLRDCVILFHSFSAVKHKDVYYSQIKPNRLVIARYLGLLRFLADHHDYFEVSTMAEAAANRAHLLQEQVQGPSFPPDFGTLAPLCRKGVQAINRLYWI